MIIYEGSTDDDASLRAAKMKYLKQYFNQADDAKAIAMLSNDALATSKGKAGEKLIISGHGDRYAYFDFTAQQFFDRLVSKGLGKGRFSEIYILACDVGVMAQDNSVTTNFAKDFGRLIKINPATTGAKVYAPRGVVSWTVQYTSKLGQRIPSCTDVVVETPERNYPLNEGLVWVNP